jgi:hypothetical protein
MKKSSSPRCVHLGVGILLAIVAGIGCSRSKSVLPLEESRMEESLEIRPAAVDLGRLQWGATAEGMFIFRNLTSSPLSLRLGEPNCACLNAILEPRSPLEPQAEGSLTVQLATKTRNSAGRVEAGVPLFVGKNSEQHVLRVAGYLEGVVVPFSYAVRPAHFQSGDIPPLQLTLVTSESDTPFALRSMQLYRKPPKKTPISGFQFQPEKMKMAEASPSWEGDYFRREIEVPACITEEIKSPIEGEISITYRVREEEHSCSVDLYLLPK